MTSRRTFLTGLMATAAAPAVPLDVFDGFSATLPAADVFRYQGFTLGYAIIREALENGLYGGDLISHPGFAAAEAERTRLYRELSGTTDLMRGTP